MRNYETFSTTADTGIRFSGRTFAELYGNSLRGLNLLLFGRNSRPPRGGEIVPFRFRGDGPENVLVNLLAEALFQVYQRNRRVATAEFGHADRVSLEARLFLAPCPAPPGVEVKSVTYHDLLVTEAVGILRAAVVFDV